jgi:hypothetical protein
MINIPLAIRQGLSRLSAAKAAHLNSQLLQKINDEFFEGELSKR